jgi:ribosomal protein S18 acetylase RimI-like enzyme
LENERVIVPRIAGQGDTSELARMNKLFNEVDEPAGHYAARMQNPRCVDIPILAEIDGRSAGFANLRLLPQLWYAEPYAEVTELYVEENFRRLGVGRTLITYAEKLAREGGAQEIFILTGVENHAARSLYRNLGYSHQELALSKNLNE